MTVRSVARSHPARPDVLIVAACGACGEDGTKRVRAVRSPIEVVRCVRCGLVRATTMRDPGTLYVDGYHEGGAGSTDHADPLHQAHERAVSHDRLAAIERHHRGGILADIGGGIGLFAGVARTRGWSPRVIDPVPAAIDAVRRDGIAASVGSVEKAQDLEDVDVVTLLHVLEHIPDVGPALRHLCLQMRDGALLAVEVPNLRSAARIGSGRSWAAWWPGEHVYHFTPSTLRAAVSRAGFEVLEVRTTVLGWRLLPLHSYAHAVGLLGVGRWMSRATRRGSDGPGDAVVRVADRPPHPFAHAALRVIARGEEMVGLGENVLLIARRPSR